MAEASAPSPLQVVEDETLLGLPADSIGLFVFSDVRPLRGCASLVDWHLCGRLSHALRRGTLEGRRGEQILLPASGRLQARRLFLLGLGPAAALEPGALEHASRALCAAMAAAGGRRLALAAPARPAAPQSVADDPALLAAFVREVGPVGVALDVALWAERLA